MENIFHLSSSSSSPPPPCVYGLGKLTGFENLSAFPLTSFQYSQFVIPFSLRPTLFTIPSTFYLLLYLQSTQTTPNYTIVVKLLKCFNISFHCLTLIVCLQLSLRYSLPYPPPPPSGGSLVISHMIKLHTNDFKHEIVTNTSNTLILPYGTIYK
jgi:hypothetical protein